MAKQTIEIESLGNVRIGGVNVGCVSDAIKNGNTDPAAMQEALLAWQQRLAEAHAAQTQAVHKRHEEHLADLSERHAETVAKLKSEIEAAKPEAKASVMKPSVEMRETRQSGPAETG